MCRSLVFRHGTKGIFIASSYNCNYAKLFQPQIKRVRPNKSRNISASIACAYRVCRISTSESSLRLCEFQRSQTHYPDLVTKNRDIQMVGFFTARQRRIFHERVYCVSLVRSASFLLLTPIHAAWTDCFGKHNRNSSHFRTIGFQLFFVSASFRVFTKLVFARQKNFPNVARENLWGEDYFSRFLSTLSQHVLDCTPPPNTVLSTSFVRVFFRTLTLAFCNSACERMVDLLVTHPEKIKRRA